MRRCDFSQPLQPPSMEEPIISLARYPKIRYAPAFQLAMRGLKKDQLVMRADEELSGLRWLPDNFKAPVPQEKQWS